MTPRHVPARAEDSPGEARPVPSGLDPSAGADPAAERAVDLLRALGHPIRYRIMQLLADKERYGLEQESCCVSEEVCVCRLNEAFTISPPTLSHHLKLLREAGLIEGRRDGVWIYYSIRPEALEDLQAALGTLAAGDRPAKGR